MIDMTILNLRDLNTDDIDKLGEFTLPDEGRYVATLSGAKDITSDKTGNRGTELSFSITGGKFNGVEVTVGLWNADPSAAADKQRLSHANIAKFMEAVGMIERRGKDLVAVPGKERVTDCLGAVCVVEVVHESYKTQAGAERKKAKIPFGGIWLPNDPKCKPCNLAEAKAILAQQGQGHNHQATQQQQATTQPAQQQQQQTQTQATSTQRRTLKL